MARLSAYSKVLQLSECKNKYVVFKSKREELWINHIQLLGRCSLKIFHLLHYQCDLNIDFGHRTTFSYLLEVTKNIPGFFMLKHNNLLKIIISRAFVVSSFIL